MAAGLFFVASIVISAWKWQLLLRARGLRVGLPGLVRLYWIGVFFNNFMPSSFGGDVVRLVLAHRIGGVAPVAASMLVERATGFLVLVVLGLAALLFGPALEGAGALRLVAITILVLGTLSLALLLWRGHALVRALAASRPARNRLVARVLAKVDALALALRDYGADHRALTVTCAVSVLFYAGLVLFQHAVIHALHGDLTLGQVALVAPLVVLVAALPVSINGIGITEGAFVVLYAQVGLPPEIGLASALLRRIVLLLAALPGAVFWLSERRSTAAAALPAGQGGGVA
jgi:glycosyltransferase 2 family protein